MRGLDQPIHDSQPGGIDRSEDGSDRQNRIGFTTKQTLIGLLLKTTQREIWNQCAVLISEWKSLADRLDGTRALLEKLVQPQTEGDRTTLIYALNQIQCPVTDINPIIRVVFNPNDSHSSKEEALMYLKWWFHASHFALGEHHEEDQVKRNAFDYVVENLKIQVRPK